MTWTASFFFSGSAEALTTHNVGQDGGASLKILFHGAPPQNLTSILESGMNPGMCDAEGTGLARQSIIASTLREIKETDTRFSYFLSLSRATPP